MNKQFIILFLILIFLSAFVSASKTDAIIKETDKAIEIKNLNPSYNSQILILGDSVPEIGCPNLKFLQTNLKEEDYNLNVVSLALGGSNLVELSSFLHTYGDFINITKIYVSSVWNDHWYEPMVNPCVKTNCLNFPNMGRYIRDKHDKSKWKHFWGRIFNIWYHFAYKDCMKIINNPNNNEFDYPFNHSNLSIYQLDFEQIDAQLDFISTYGELVIVIPPNAIPPDHLPGFLYAFCLYLDKDSLIETHQRYVNHYKEYAKKNNLSILDLESEFNKRMEDNLFLFFKDPYYDPIHPNKKGKDLCNELYSEHILNSIE